MKKGPASIFFKIFLSISFLTLLMGLKAQEWERGSIVTSGIDEARLNRGIQAIEVGTFGDVHSLVIVKDGKLVFEKYFRGWKADSVHQLQSATKSIVSTFLGIAIQEGMVKDVDQKVLSFYTDKDLQHVDDRKRAMSIRDLMTQRHGLKWKEAPWNAPDNTWRKVLETEGDWFQNILSHEMAVDPGSRFNYSNAAPVLTTGIVQQASGLRIDEFAKQYLFEPLGIQSYRFWQGNGGPQNNGSALLFMRPRDVAKIGQLYLQKGKWNGKQILPTNWAEQAGSTAHVAGIRDNRFYRFGYGYFWWNAPKAAGALPSAAPGVYAARGAGGQYLIVHPEENMVVVITSWDLRRANQIFQIFTEYVQAERYVKPTLSPDLMPNELLTPKVESSATLTPDGNTMFFAKKDSFYTMSSVNTVMMSKKVNGQWSEPVVAPFSGKHSDSSPFVTLDGSRVYFASNRNPDGSGTKEDRDIWFVEKNGSGWSDPRIFDVVNSEESEYSPSMDRAGNMYFGSYRDGGSGSGDIWMSAFKDGAYQAPVNLGSAINTAGGEWGSCISPDGQYLIYEASGRPTNITQGGDLYISVKKNGNWQPAIHLNELSSGASDLSPRIHGGLLYFASNRHQDFVVEMFGNNNVDLYQIKFSDILDYLKRID